MNSVTGQAEKITLFEKFSGFIRRSKEARLKNADINSFILELSASKSRLDTIKKNLELAQDDGIKEYCIYRLKAAELDFNRHLKYAKENNLTLSPFEGGIV